MPRSTSLPFLRLADARAARLRRSADRPAGLGRRALPEGDVFFAVEHIWPWSGYLDSAVASGNRAAKQVQASLAG